MTILYKTTRAIRTLLKPLVPYAVRNRIKGLIYDLVIFRIPWWRYNWKTLDKKKLPILGNLKPHTNKERVRILYVIHDLQFGGAEVMLWQLLRHIDRSRFATYIVCTKGRGDLAYMVEPIVDGFYDLSLSKKTEWQRNKEIARLITECDIDIVHFSNNQIQFFMSFILKLEKPSVRIMNWLHCDIFFFEMLYRYGYKHLSEVIDHTITVNKNMESIWSTRNWPDQNKYLRYLTELIRKSFPANSTTNKRYARNIMSGTLKL